MQQTTPNAYLIIQLGTRWTDVLRLQADQTVVIGRASDSDVVVKEDAVSRKHAQVSPLSGGWGVEDLGSRNGTLVDSSRISGSHSLSDGETIEVGSCRILFTTSLKGGFPGGERQQGVSAQPLEGHATVDLGKPTIVNRLSNSQWSGIAMEDPSKSATSAPEIGSRATGEWSFFYQLIYDLVACGTPEQSAQTALDRLLARVHVSSGGVVSFGPSAWKQSKSTQEPVGSQTGPKTWVQPPMAVLATKQSAGTAYHRVSDFLVETVLRERQALLARNVMDDSNLSFARESARRETVSIVCAPVFDDINLRSNVIGLLHIYTVGEERMLTEADLDLCVGVADNLALALASHASRDALAQSLESSQRRIDELQQQLEASTEMIGRSDRFAQVRASIKKAAPTSATVLVRGESGVGKELVARAIHLSSQRKAGALVCLNCAALAPTLLESELFGHEKGAFTGATERKVGKFEAADGGTILLDEIGEMSQELQAKFLRVLEGQPFERLGGHKPIKTDVRVIAATNRDLEEAVRNKEFRSDLYYRLRVIEIDVPPLRERMDDIPLLVEFFVGQLRQHAGRQITGIEPEALEKLSRHMWPGNVRELRNVVERAIVLGTDTTLGVGDIDLSSLGGHVDAPEEKHDKQAASQEFQPLSLGQLEKEHIYAMLKFTSGNKSKASQMLGIERSTLDRKLKRFEANSQTQSK